MAMFERLRRLVRRPEEMVEATRWLFAALTLVSLLLGLMAMLGGEHLERLVGLAGTLMLSASVVATYRQRRVALGWELLDTAALLAVTLAAPEPNASLGFVFASLWFRSLYGGLWRSLLRCTLYSAAMTAGVLLWAHVPWHDGGTDLLRVAGVFPTLFLTVVVSRHLAGLLHAREQAFRRDAVLAAVGPELLGLTDADEILRAAWEATGRICTVTPGLRAIRAVRCDEGLRVTGTAGELAAVPGVLPGAILRSDDVATETRHSPVHRTVELDRAAGRPCRWVSIRLPAVGSGSRWLLLGSPDGDLSEAAVSVSGLVNQVAMALRNSRIHHDLTIQATRDSLTGLANRAAFNAALAADLADGDRHETAVLFIDLDDFKAVNDQLGHRAGDDFLREMARRLDAATRGDDVCARLGGDEFAVILGSGAPAAVATARRIADTLSRPVHFTDHAAQVTASVGVATATAEMDLQALLHSADVAMYAAKGRGKGRVVEFDLSLHAGPTAQAFERELAAAADNGELVVHYQPVLDLTDGRCTAVEALVRWDHPERGLLGPDAFIAVAERTGSIRDIGRFVLRQSCADMAAWRRAHPHAPTAVHVNLSAAQLDDPAFVDEVDQCLAEFAMPAERLVLEITESLVISSEAAIEQLMVLAARGVVLAIDDFGTGYSALTTLRTLPVSIVKIDKSFVARCTASAKDLAVIEAVVLMARKLGMRTIAEGVEQSAQQAVLDHIGADSAQGYLYLRPTTCEGIHGWLESQAAERPELTA